MAKNKGRGTRLGVLRNRTTTALSETDRFVEREREKGKPMSDKCKCKKAVGGKIDSKELDSLQEILGYAVDDEKLVARINTFFNTLRKALLDEQGAA